MKELAKLNILIFGLTMCLLTILVFWALGTDRCLEIESRQLKINASCYSNIEKWQNYKN